MITHFLIRGRVLFVIQALFPLLCFAQSYPYWFLNQGSVKCGHVEVGYANPSFYPDSAAVRAIRDGFGNYARHKSTAIDGGQAFWSTEIGTYWMGSNFTESFDSTGMKLAETVLRPLDTLATENFISVLLVSSECDLIEQYRARVNLKGRPAPSWIESLPDDDNYYFARGVAPKYYYETSSWREAEKAALRNLARTVYTKMQIVQKVGREGQSIMHEEVSVVLRNITIVSRWRDLDEDFFYLLVRMPRHF